MTIAARYVHTNLVAENWPALADFYQQVFGCTRVPPERDLKGAAVEAGTGIPGAHIRGAHLRLPGCGEDGPTLEIFQYDPRTERGDARVNRLGFGHIAFSVPDVPAARQVVLRAGGKPVGEVVSIPIAAGAVVTWCYVTDPEGNIIELQAWSQT